ncbi:ATP/GTP-binding protein [Oculatella sp. LEGE 06141]|uniref:GTP-binding protein n=1 Tax=Oculatella sp. LEGE 06141 TaxID=1828648 RepID=UPI0018829B37|nr:ATP/GTP-binding protein [Oculatella sp. LEGE 06141]MBE9181205.1 ATP/GTP-binding protein [Oculatella sp. LEGE 06141]
MELMRLVITGTVGAGKSTFIRTVSEIEVVDTDRKPTDATASMKKSTTVAMDFGRFTFGSDMRLHLYGTPGQTRFDFMWELLAIKANALILLVAAHRPEDFRAARQTMAFINQRVKIPMLLGVTHTDCEGAWSVEDVALAMGYDDQSMPFRVVAVNANDKESVIQALIALVEHYMSVEELGIH